MCDGAEDDQALPHEVKQRRIMLWASAVYLVFYLFC